MWRDKQREADSVSPSPAIAPRAPTASAASTDAIRPSASSGRTPAWLGPGTRVEGEIFGDEDLHVDGKVEGPVSLGGHRLTLGNSGRVTGEVVAREVVVYGAIDGDIRAHDRVEIKKAGSVIGDLTTARILIEEGAYFKGHIEIDRSTQVGADLNTLLSRGAPGSLKELKHPEREVDAVSGEGSRSRKKEETSGIGDGPTGRGTQR
jgi:cytoskeletal protein CcmA (bactofilin family)